MHRFSLSLYKLQNGSTPSKIKIKTIRIYKINITNIVFFYLQEEVLLQFSDANNKDRFDFLRRLVNRLPDEELHGLVELTKKAVKRRCRAHKKGTAAILGKSKGDPPRSVPVSHKCVPVPLASSAIHERAWYEKYKKSDILSLDVEKVII